MAAAAVTATSAAAVTVVRLITTALSHRRPRDCQPPVITLPGNAVGAGGALTVGANEFCAPDLPLEPPVTDFSDGDGGAVMVGADGGGVSDFSLVAQAPSIPMPRTAAAPAATAVRRTVAGGLMVSSLKCAD
jgi:hypothetical protein